MIAVLFALSATVVCHLVFIYWLKLSLEKGILEFKTDEPARIVFSVVKRRQEYIF